MKPPRIAIMLTAAGALPFLAGAAMVLGFWLGMAPAQGQALLQFYGLIILSFMSGVLWGFAARGGPGWAYGLSVLPALYAFFAAPGHPWSIGGQVLSHLVAGFLLVLVLDAVFQARGLAPRWWLSLRLPVTALVLACLWVARID
ncbi:MAG: DUF3429 domain-containing protein [Pararhodobacter sp.]|nr:DUF3429 domain-containing protein [Pararhodobacter sp.]